MKDKNKILLFLSAIIILVICLYSVQNGFEDYKESNKAKEDPETIPPLKQIPIWIIPASEPPLPPDPKMNANGGLVSIQ
jgi:hypothetical protein